MSGIRRIITMLTVGVAATVLGSASGVGAAATPAGDIATTTAPRPPFTASDDRPALTRALFSTPDGAIACRRVYSEMVWIECLLKKTDEIVRFGPDESWIDTPCKAPLQSETCRMGFGAVYIAPAATTTSARFSGARRVPLERLVDLGQRTLPFPSCVADPNLGLMCTTGMDDQIGQLIVFGLAGSIWSCPGYESVPGETPVPELADRCRVVRT